MIRFSLHCDAGHDFEAWFRGNDDFETQRQRGLGCGGICIGYLELYLSLLALWVQGGKRVATDLMVSNSNKQTSTDL